MKIPQKKNFNKLLLIIHQLLTFKTLFMNLYKKCNAKSYSFLVIDITFALYNSLHFRKNLLEKI